MKVKYRFYDKKNPIIIFIIWSHIIWTDRILNHKEPLGKGEPPYFNVKSNIKFPGETLTTLVFTQPTFVMDLNFVIIFSLTVDLSIHIVVLYPPVQIKKLAKFLFIF